MTSPVRPGLCSITFRHLPAEDVIGLAISAGLEGIEWGADVHVPIGDHDRAAEVAARCADAGIACPSYGTYLGFGEQWGDPSAAAATAVALGADNLRIWTPLGTEPDTDDATRASITAEVAATVAAAADHGLTVGVEFHGWTLTHHAASAVRLVEAVDASDLFTYWQPVYWDAQVQDDDERQLAEFERLIPHLSHLHTDWRVDGARRPLEEIEPLWRAVLAALPATGRWIKPRFAFIEYVPGDDPAALVREAHLLRSWIDDASGG